MELIYLNKKKAVNILKNQVVAIGEFDGLHEAHLKVLNETLIIAKENKRQSAVISFDPHPDFILKKRHDYSYITPLSEKKKILENLGFDNLIIIKFDDEFAKLSYRHFFDFYLKETFCIVVGFDFRFGYLGAGTVNDLKKLHNNVHIISQISIDQSKIGSQLIRELLLNGELEKANKLLGRKYSIFGKVVHGAGIGTKLGIKTSNINIEEQYQLLKTGVYAVKVIIQQKIYFGVANFGNNPTVNYIPSPRLEVHILDFHENIYGQIIEVVFYKYIRSEMKFLDAEHLKNQIKIDIQNTREFLTTVKD